MCHSGMGTVKGKVVCDRVTVLCIHRSQGPHVVVIDQKSKCKVV